MQKNQPRTLEDLRNAAEAAWLWDGARGRIVWANGTGVRLFDGTSVFDLVDRPFDLREQGVARIKDMTQALNPGESTEALLHFPSVGLAAPVACHCTLHLLADGRQGLLVVMEPAKPAITRTPATLADATLEALPSPVLVCDAQGRIHHGNEAARSFVDLDAIANLSDLLTTGDKAERLLARLADSRLTSVVESMNSRLGARDCKITALKPDDQDLIILVIEDVTDRRALEREPTVSPPPPAITKEKAFEKLAQSLKNELAEAAPPKLAKALAAVPESKPGPAKQIHVPDAIRQPLEQSGEAVIVGRGASAMFATRKAADLLQRPDAADVVADVGLWQSLSLVPEVATHKALPLPSGGTIDLVVSRSNTPWLNGPAEQFVLRRAAVKPATRPAVLPKAEAPATVVVPPAAITVAPSPPAPADTRETIAHDEMKAILDVASDGIITLDRDGRILSFSAGAEAIFDRSIGDVIDRPLADLLHPDSSQVLRDYLAALNGPGLASMFNDGREVTALVKPDGSVPLFMTIGKLQSPKSRAAFCAVLRDITPWKRTERELLKAKEEAEAASRQKSEFLARISHELRTPLNAIMGFSEVMRLERFGAIKNDKYRGYANDIHASGAHLLSLINDLLDLSKIESGKLELNFAAVSLVDVVDNAVKLLNDEARQARVIIRKSIGPALPRVVADQRAMRQIMLNLLSNAIKYTDAGGEVILSAVLNETGDLSLRVKDSGIGMNASQIKDALEPFTRVETQDRQRQGTGLGLPLTKALVEANRAAFKLTSEPGKGTLAEINFPVTRVLAE